MTDSVLATDISSMTPVVAALALLLMNSCYIFLQLIDRRTKPEFKPSIWVHMVTVMLLVFSVTVALVALCFHSMGLMKLSLLLAAASTISMLLCALLLTARLGLLGEKMRKLCMAGAHAAFRNQQGAPDLKGKAKGKD